MPTKILVLKKLQLKEAVLIVGLPGIGLVGKISVDYLLKHLKAELVAEVLSDSFPQSVHTKDSKIHLIKDDIFWFNHKGKDFVILAGPVQPPIDSKPGFSQEHYEFSETLLTFFKSLGVTEIVTLAGINIGDNRISQKPGVIAAATDDEILNLWKKFGAKEDKKEGLISGTAGLMIGLGKLHGIKGTCLMGETNSQLIYGDHGSAKAVILVMCKRFGFKVKMEGIDKDTKAIETAFKELAQQLDDSVESSGERPNYVR
jgi:uncharacterized protein (TIGR00162 family)